MSSGAPPSLVVLTGASGAGKTALAVAVRRQHLHGCEVLHFDSIGVPTKFPQSRHDDQPGGTWQREKTLQWMSRVAAILNAGTSALFEGQMRIAFIEEALRAAGISRARILLLDCDDDVRTSDRVQGRWAELGYSWWTIVEQRSAEIVGAGCVQNLRRGGGISSEVDLSCPLEIGWRVRRDKWRQGIAMEAARAMAQFAFARLQADVLYAVCLPENKASMGVMVKLGMHYRGIEDWYGMKLTTYMLSADQWRGAS